MKCVRICDFQERQIPLTPLVAELCWRLPRCHVSRIPGVNEVANVRPEEDRIKMSSAMSSEAEAVDVGPDEFKLDQFDDRFVASFERASDRRLRVLYDEIAPMLRGRFEQLATAGKGQIEVLNGVAEFLGLEELDVSKPLADEASEVLAQRIAWRSAARWTVLSLLWALVEHRPTAMGPGDWAPARSKPRSRSSLPSTDEPLALDVAAERLTSAFAATNGAGLALLDLPVVIAARAGSRVAADAVRPVGLVETSSEVSNSGRIELVAGDRIWLAGPEGSFFSVDAEYESSGPLDREITGDGELKLDAQTCVAGVVQGVALLYEGKSVEQGS